MRDRPRLVIVGLSLAAAIIAAACGGSTATPLPTAPPTSSEVPSSTPPPVVETLPPASLEPATTSPSPSAKATAGGTRYKIKKGDTLWAISVKFGVTLKALEKANPGIEAHALKIGQVIIIPAK